ncbi:protein lingerer-like isoform X3 [Plodia interpunctella]|uniref:protein lingerer-like isoform X3 n=1 Tax=Plodia interpunctella TaxID=58824 RepID=UPI0023682D34|nr:protein lingerer-like isoform X3 [Plodia interpunctella]
MSLGARATKGGAKVGKDKHAPEKAKGADKPQPKEKIKPQATTEQLRMAHMIDRKSEDASDVRRMVLELMEMTCRTEEEVCSALHDSDNDLEAACNLLLEDQRIQGEWQTSEKKKKKPLAAADAEPEPARERSAPRPRRGEGEGGRGSGRGGGARGRGAGRGGRGAARGGRRGGTAARARGLRPDHDWSDNNHTSDAGNMGDSFPATEDWDNEEWSGSLSDTKVFTPSSNTQNQPETEPTPVQAPTTEDWDAAPPNGPAAAPESHIPTYTYHNAHHSIIDQINSANNHTAAAVAAVASATQPPTTKDQLDAYHSHHHQPMGMSGSLSAAQSQYLSQLTAQSQRPATSPAYPQYPAGAAFPDSARKQPRARLPPPSKIPSSAVEMPHPAQLLDVQFGALSPDIDGDHDRDRDRDRELSSPLPAETAAPADTSASTLEKLSACMQQLGAHAAPAPNARPQHKVHAHTAYQLRYPAVPQSQPPQQPTPTSQQQPTTPQQQPQQQPQPSQQNVYHHPVSHHPPVYQPNVYAAQVNSTNASLPAASAMSTYPSSVTLTQYQPIINSYQQQPGVTVCVAQTTVATPNVAAGYSALYTTGTAYYQHPPHKLPPTTQYESAVSASNSLTSTSTTQTSTAKVATTTAAHVSVTASGGGGGGSGSGSGGGSGMGSAGYAAAALYGAAGSAAYAYDDQLMQRTTTLPHHMTGYYEVGYGVGGVSGARDSGFGLGAGERFGRADAASPQQVPAALPPGYAYFYQPPPSSYQYGVYPYGGSAPAKQSYTQQYDQDYKGGPYSGAASKTAAGNTADLSNAMYKTHVLNKVNSYEKATFHSGTPPPFGAGSHLYIPAPPHHHHHHQMDARVNSSHNRRESGAAGGRSSSAKPPQSKPTYSQSYWAPN